MLEATKLAKKGLFSTSPNPNVGCVIVHKDKIISKEGEEYIWEELN